MRMNTAGLLRRRARWASRSDWDYTRKSEVKRIEFYSDANPLVEWWGRLRAALGVIFKRTYDIHGGWRGYLAYKWAYFTVYLKKEPNRPDGILADGRVIVFWEEDGEYLELMQPSVGVLVADFLENDPTNQYAIKIKNEIDRIVAGVKKVA